MMRGYLSIEKELSIRHRLTSNQQLRVLIPTLAVGVLVGIFASQTRLHLGLPGHKALLWITAAVMVRIYWGCWVGSTAAALTAAVTTVALGGNFAGNAAYLPMVGAAGIILDTTIGLIERWKLWAVLSIPMIGFAAMVANLVCLAKRLFSPLAHKHHILCGISGIYLDVLCYAFFGLLAGLAGAICAYMLMHRQRRVQDK